jgi:insertion element IS1 protein InsB
MLSCPSCESKHVVKNGRIHNGKQNYRCWECGRQFVQDPQNTLIDQATKDLIDKLLLERLSLAGIARVTEGSELWLQRYVNAKYAAVPRRVGMSAKKKGD